MGMSSCINGCDDEYPFGLGNVESEVPFVFGNGKRHNRANICIARRTVRPVCYVVFPT